ncbi:inositol 1,4,5-trisphosphate receptor-interacting protein-like 1 [Cyrtonyx montezumae]|uniref:inositol 1,4,5-trisphosphate receptor-interacting protein-like 1 n=1 Tax=Cyrtonyx montezumae TaxID=9017 RepID=UPI0032D9CE84
MQQRAEFLREKMTELLQEVEQRERYHSWMDMQALLFAVLPFWKIVTVLCVFGLLFWFIWKIERKFWADQDNSEEECSCSDEEQEQELEQEQDEEEKQKEDEKTEEDQQEQEKDEDKQQEDIFSGVDMVLSIQSRQENCEEILLLFNDLISIIEYFVADTFFPVPAPPIEIDSANEGRRLLEEEIFLCLLVSLNAPRGHIFHLELHTAQEMPGKKSQIRVELKCTCGFERNLKMLCFIHTSKNRLKNQQPSLLESLCTGFYLDVEKTAYWFTVMIKTAWNCLPQSAICRLKVMQSRRSCKLQLIDISGITSIIEIKFGVQQGNTDIFLSSEETEAAYMPSTTWPQTCAVAEAKFFKHIAARAEEDNFYLRYMQLCAYILRGYNFSIYELKTVLMHLLTKIPIESWSWKYFVLRMDDILRYLHCCLEEKRLDHFFIGNEEMPAEIILPREFRVSRPPNLFQHLAQHPDRHEQALYEMEMLQNRFTTLLTTGK